MSTQKRSILIEKDFLLVILLKIKSTYREKLNVFNKNNKIKNQIKSNKIKKYIDNY